MPTIKKRLYAEIAKSEKQPDGTLIVEGFASTGSQDSDGETITPDAMKAAIPDYMRFGAVREMHDAKKAAGTALEIEVLDDGRTRFVSHVVDPVAVVKVETGVYKGFSIGGSVPKGGRDPVNKTQINALNLIEVSLVDRPANPEAVITCFKAEGVEPENENDEVDDPEALNKGLWNMQRMLEALATLRSCASEVKYEVQNGEHDPGTIDAIKSCVGALGEFCQKYLGEELAIMMKAAEPNGDVLQKAQSDLAAITEERDTLKKSLAESEDLNKAALAEVSEIAKAAKIPVADGAGYIDLVKATLGELLPLRMAMDDLRKKAAPAKAFVNGVAISKSEDEPGKTGATVEPVVKSGGEIDEVATLIKASHAKPLKII
jgi:phage head maturation protease